MMMTDANVMRTALRRILASKSLKQIRKIALEAIDGEGASWVPLPDFPNYRVSDRGDVMNIRSGLVLIPKVRSNGYLEVTLQGDGKRQSWLVHRLVFRSFVGPVLPGLHVCHIDGNPRNNDVANLLQATCKVNMSHRVAHGTSPVGERNPKASIKNAEAKAIKASLKRAERDTSGRLKRGVAEQIAAQHGTTKRVVLKINHNAAWLDV